MPRKPIPSLTILTTPSNKPFKSSRLALPTSPFSPQWPITPPPKARHLAHPIPIRPSQQRTQIEHASPPPSNPLNWLWQCHLCHRTYRLGTTRRCLDDGHYFCAGTTVVKRGKRHPGGRKVVRHKACQSEFDYQGWKVWGSWRRRVEDNRERRALRAGTGVVVFGIDGLAAGMETGGRGSRPRRDSGVVFGESKKDCWNQCDYPSECRWGKQFGVRTPSPPPVFVPSSPSITTGQLQSSCHGRGNLETTSAAETLLSFTASSNSHDEGIKKPSMDDLLASAKRRKRRSVGAAPSPLASNPPSVSAAAVEEEEAWTAQGLQKAFDDCELEFRKSFGELASGLGMGRRGSAPSTMLGREEKAASSPKTMMKRKEKSPSRRTGGDV